VEEVWFLIRWRSRFSPIRRPFRGEGLAVAGAALAVLGAVAALAISVVS
jgi:hypothetical protein